MVGRLSKCLVYSNLNCPASRGHKDSLLPGAGWTLPGHTSIPRSASSLHTRPEERLTAGLHPADWSPLGCRPALSLLGGAW